MKRQLLFIMCLLLLFSVFFTSCKKQNMETDPTPEAVPTEPTKTEPSAEAEPLPTETDTTNEIETIIGGTPVLMLNETTTEGTVKKGDLILISLPIESEEGYEWIAEAPEGVDKTGAGISAPVDDKEMIPTPDAEAMPTSEDDATPAAEEESESSATPDAEASPADEGETTPTPEGEEMAKPVGEQHHFGFKASEAKEFTIKMMLKGESETKEEIDFTITVTE